MVDSPNILGSPAKVGAHAVVSPHQTEAFRCVPGRLPGLGRRPHGKPGIWRRKKETSHDG